MSEDDTDSCPMIIKIDDERINGTWIEYCEVGGRDLNDLLDAEAERLCNADHYERTEEWRDYRSGHYARQLHKAGEVTLKVSNCGSNVGDGDHRTLSQARELLKKH